MSAQAANPTAGILITELEADHLVLATCKSARRQPHAMRESTLNGGSNEVRCKER